MTEINATMITPKPTITANIKSRQNLAIHHLFAACRFSARVKEIEATNSNQPLGAFWDEILHNSLGVATLTVAALESYSNELYFEGTVLKSGVNDVAADELASIIDRVEILKKYSLALAISSGKKLDLSSTETVNAKALINLRNNVIHFHPEWFDEQEKHKKVSNHLLYKFKPSKFFPDEPIFPRAWASYDFTKWALSTTIKFIDYYHSEAGIPSPLDTYKTQILELSSGE